ncbi:MAG: sensor domain-containing phosphodiesterase [Actinobacteria bacterium]|nr:sensor domain-containing phosphodiesterase [Actinomycetota bacterium]
MTIAERLALLQRTVADLVSDSSVREVVGRVLDGAARAVRAPGFVLLLDEPAWADGRVFGRGLDEATAAEIATQVVDAPDGAHHGRLVAEIRSARRSYGRLVAVGPQAVDFLQAELATLRCYARLAAAALDSATALAEARQQARIAHVLLELATDLAEASSVDEVAARTARAVPALLGCERAVVLLPDPDGTAGRLAGHMGFPAGGVPALRGFAVPASALPGATQAAGHRADDLLNPYRSITGDSGPLEALTVPITSNGTLLGWVVALIAATPDLPGRTMELAERLGGLTSHAATAIRNARLHEELSHRAVHDALTGLPNRTLILDRIEQLLARVNRNNNVAAALHIGVDRFRDVNDNLGHEAGDELLRAVADRLNRAVRDTDTVGRLSGDEFVVLVEGDRFDAGPQLAAERLLHVLREPFQLGGAFERPLTVTATIGIAVAETPDSRGLLRDADIALRAAKAAGRDRYTVFHNDMRALTSQRLELDMALRSALDDGQFRLVYQPVVELTTMRVTGVEALLRWRHPRLGEVQPDRFIPLLERDGLIRQVGAWVLHEACRQASALHAAGCRLDMAVNVSAEQLTTDLLDTVNAALAAAELDPEFLLLEITESVLMHDAEHVAELLAVLKERGARIAIDDFGTGYSSLAYVRQFPVDALKIDRSFVAGMSDSTESDALIHTLVQLGRILGLTTIAEGIENANQLERLREAGCSAGQGYLVAAPLEPAELLGFLYRYPPGRAAISRSHPVAGPAPTGTPAARTTGGAPAPRPAPGPVPAATTSSTRR